MIQNSTIKTQSIERVIFLDLIRVLACFMVIMVHSGEFFYIGAGDTVIREHWLWVNTYGSLLRSCVPLFVVISGYLILPIKESPSIFYKKRFTRIIFPFLFWSIVYAILPYILGDYDVQKMISNLLTIPLNFNGHAGHLWFVYMLIGLYLFIPFISPWISVASKNAKLLFLFIWTITLFTHFIRRIYPQLFGEAHWNEFHSFSYFSGYLGYLVLGAFLRQHLVISRKQSVLIGIPLFFIGYAITFFGFYLNVYSANTIPELEITWRFTTINVDMMTVGIFLLFRGVQISSPTISRIIREMSMLSYGVYLAHIIILNQAYRILHPILIDPVITIPVVALTTFLVTYLIIKTMSYLPKAKYLIG